tara:strand:+ start:679 stop:840 length:162 start_codon:yes stop_codon:yes gene_type:complete
MDTSIKIKESTKRKLSIKKYTLELKSIDEVIQRMDKIITKFKLWEELKEVNKK